MSPPSDRSDFPGDATFCATSPRELFERIRNLFSALGILGTPLSIECDGASYRLTCDETSFMVYRVNVSSKSRHHVPGWPVCLVNDTTVFEECRSPASVQDHCACELDVDRWLELVRTHNSKMGLEGERPANNSHIP